MRLHGVSRKYRVLHERNATLKEALIRRRRTRAEDHWVLREVDLDIAPGESVGVIGRNGIGKSTLLKLVAGIIPPQAGRIEVGGVVAPLLELGAGFHIDFTGRENIEMQGALYGLTPAEIAARFDEIVAFSELSDYIEMPVRTYSSGMFMRLAFSIAAHVEADVLLLDEVLAVGDVAFQRKCVTRIQELRSRGSTLLFVSHSREAVEQVCDRCILLDHGAVVFDGAPLGAFAAYAAALRQAGHEGNGPAGDARDRGGASWGSGAVELSDVSVSARDAVDGQLEPGAPAVIAFSATPAGGAGMPLFRVSLATEDGPVLGAIRSDDIPGRESDSGGPWRIALELPRLPLRPGRFQVSVTAEDRETGEVLHHLERCASFSVFGETAGGGPIVLEGRWRTSLPARSGSALD